MNSALKALAVPISLVVISGCSGPSTGGRSSASPSPSAVAGGAPDSSPGGSGASAASPGASPAGSRTSGSGSRTSNVDSCVVGRWQSTAFKNGRLGTATISGGAGVYLTITNSGDLTVDYSGMQPVEIRLGSGSTGTGSLQGVGHAVIATNEGTITPSNYDGSGVTVNAVLHSRDGIDTPVSLPLGDVFGASVPENYTCDRSSLTLMRQGPLPNLVYRRQ
jgi:hypothetical protein